MANKKTSKLTPVGGNILVEPLNEETVTASGIVLPDTVSKEKPQKGKVTALGSGKLDQNSKLINFNVKVGDTIIFKKYGPDEIELGDNKYLIMEETDVLAILES